MTHRHIPNCGALYGGPPYHANSVEPGQWTLADFDGRNSYGFGRNTTLDSAETAEDIIRAYGYVPAPRRVAGEKT